MANLHEIVQWCNQTLKTNEFKDYAPNGLQIEGRTEVNKILCAVTASEDAIDAAIEQNADVLLVHHGYFWKGEPYPITGMRGNRIKKLIQNNISLVAYHLPLDSHPTLGNNAAIADLIGLNHLEALDPFEKHPIGNIGSGRFIYIGKTSIKYQVSHMCNITVRKVDNGIPIGVTRTEIVQLDIFSPYFF